MTRFAGKVVLVTGAANGIGAAIAQRFADEGADLSICDVDGAALEAFAQDLRATGRRVLARTVDVSRQDEVEALIAGTVSVLGRLDVLVNNAAIGAFGKVTELAPEAWSRVMAVGLDSVFFASRAAMPHLRETGGCIVNTGSISGLFGDYGLVAYNTMKGAVANLTRNMAIDHAGEGVRVNAVAPGGVRTPGARAFEAADFQLEYQRLIPMGRMAEAPEIAGVVAFLASSDASYVTGVNLVADGGVTAATGQPNFHRVFSARTG